MHRAGLPADLPIEHDTGVDVGQARRGLAPGRDRDHRLRGLRPGHHLEFGGAGPQDGESTRRRHRRGGNGALLDILEPVRAMAPEPHGAAAVHRHPHPTAPAQPGGVSGNGLHLDGPLHAGQPLQLLGDAEGLQPALRPDVHVLEVAPAAPPRPGVRAGGLHAVGGGGQDVDGVRPQVGGGARRDPRPHPLARKAVADEDHLAVGCPAHAAPAGGDGAHLELQDLRVLHDVGA